MRVIVTGASGFVGRYLIQELTANRHDVVALDRRLPEPAIPVAAHYETDLRNMETLTSIVDREQPDACIHLAAISSIPTCKDNPLQAMQVNVIGTQHLLEVFRNTAPAARFLFVSTGHAYGVAAREETVDEDVGLAPDSLYAASKAAADQLTLAYARTYNMPTLVARPNNHIGPGQSSQFVVASLAAQIKALATTPPPHSLSVGNLESVRDFTDVRDVVRAYRLLLESGQAGQAYNIGSSKEVSVGWIVKTLCSLAGVTPTMVVSPARFRPTDHSPRLDTGRIRKDTGWAPSIPLETTLRDILAASSP